MSHFCEKAQDLSHFARDTITRGSDRPGHPIEFSNPADWHRPNANQRPHSVAHFDGLRPDAKELCSPAAICATYEASLSGSRSQSA